MSSAHIFYIPIMIAVGFFCGYFFGLRAADAEHTQAQKRLERRKRQRIGAKDGLPKEGQ